MTCLQTYIHIDTCMYLVLSKGAMRWRCCDSRAAHRRWAARESPVHGGRRPPAVGGARIASARRDIRSPSRPAALHILVATSPHAHIESPLATGKFAL